MSAKWIVAVGYLLAIPLSVFAGADKTAVATRTDTPPVVDGHLSDRCWDLAVPTTDFVLLDPVEGAPAANQTVVKILYTADQLYIGLFMADSNAENIDARVVPRDGRFAPRDLIGILLDTQHDHRNAYGFYINPYGIQHDFQMTDDGAKGYRGNNKGWDGVWRAEAAVLDSGWSAEVAIAFSTLAFAAGDDMVWGFNLERLSITGRERSHWAAIYQEDGSVLRVSQAGHLVGLRGIDPGLRLELLPYAASGVDRTHADWRGRATYFATKRLFLRGFAQDAGYLHERDINLLASYEIAPKSRIYLAYNLGDTAAERAKKLRFKVAYLLSY